MSDTHKPFRELIPPGTSFEFVGKTRLWVTVSILAVAATIALLFFNQSSRGQMLNWSIDFKGGTEIVLRFDGERSVGPGDVRTALQAAGFEGVEVSGYAWKDKDAGGNEVLVNGLRLRTPEYGAVDAAQRDAHAEAFAAKFADRNVLKVNWSGDTMFVRSRQPFAEAEVAAFFTSVGLEMKPWGDAAQDFAAPEEGTGEFNAYFAIWGVDRQYQLALSERLEGATVSVVQVYGVGPKAGAQLRNDGIRSMFYATLLIMLYLVVRFDVRYAPGAVIALTHDAIIVVGAFAVTWTEFSLTSVAAILTVIGYSVNDTVIVFDRIRENTGRLTDKKFARIVNISINETLSRTLLTSGTTFATTLMMNIFGTGMVRDFAFAMNIGIVVGTYSSIFIASPVVMWIHRRYFAAPVAAAEPVKAT
jgi:preprotein translocase subunit SecF